MFYQKQCKECGEWCPANEKRVNVNQQSLLNDLFMIKDINGANQIIIYSHMKQIYLPYCGSFIQLILVHLVG